MNELHVSKADREIRMEREFDCPIELLWRAFAEPELLARWWGRGNPLRVIEFTPEAGGFWHFIELADGQEHGFRGRFREVVPMRTMVYSFEYDGMPGYVTIDHLEFETLANGRSRLTSITQFHTQDELEGMMASGMADGAAESYRALDRLLAVLISEA